MSLWANFALGFTYLSPLVGVYSLLAVALSTGGPPSMWWIVIVAGGQMLVALVFGEVVSQFPIAGGIYPWARRLWGKRYAWMAAWVYICALIVTITSVAEFGSGFVASLFGLELTKNVTLVLALALLVLALAINFSGTKWLARIARIGLFAELIGVIGLGLFLLLFERKHSFTVFFDAMGTAGEGSYVSAFMGAAVAGLFLFYGFEACGDVAEEVSNPARRIPRAMIMTILVGAVSALFSFGGYVLAAPDLDAIVAGEVVDPIPAILEGSLGTTGAKIFLLVALTAFISCVLSLQAAASRLIFSFARDGMMPGHRWLAHVTESTKVPRNALIVACTAPALICVLIWLNDGILVAVTSFAILGIYLAFQMVVLGALRQRIRGWKPAGPWSLGGWGLIVNVLALAYGIFAMILLARPGTSGDFVADYIVLIGLVVVLAVGLVYLVGARPDRKSDAPEGDAVAVAEAIRSHRSR
ncbi:amino acid/polyamine/organocation transporter (APC superfamily) [Brevibacterium sanguinis]|uniref:Amino acid/polyamine/organocation transporter (APC superfamily) n=2 Tax=Brevibacterium TaxID=1696 RepID=A0A366IM31_9MICO|nr:MULTISPECIES: amino acid permease [Brevibacterium]RBP65698.1 amino acid/polyamine/organocation transporter (APC superfamily) [Brevibacterium sanguinis]RBP72332.1 amino acid/polyamine/organocation transporter (APC superfamily) [Brevibacterium celere]